MTPAQLVARKTKLASTAKALITGDVGLVPASLHISRALRALESEAPSSFGVFEQFYEAIPLKIPLGVARLQWPIELLLEFDAELVQVECRFRPALLRASAELVKTFG